MTASILRLRRSFRSGTKSGSPVGQTGRAPKRRAPSVLCWLLLLGVALVVLRWRGSLWLRRPRGEKGESRRGRTAPAPIVVAQADMDMVLAAGVPLGDAEGVAALVEAVGARGPEPLSDPLMLLRFYLARSRDVPAAAAMFRSTLDWRAAFPIRGVMADYGWGAEYAEDGCRATDIAEWGGDKGKARPLTPAAQLAQRFAFFGRLPAAGPDGAPVLLWRAGLADYPGFVREGLVEILIQAFVVHLEDALQSARAASLRARKLVNAHLVIDALGFGTTNLVYVAVLRRVLVLCQEYYPEVTASIAIIRAPAAMAQLYRLLRPWLTPRMRQKISILGEDFESTLREHSGLEVSMLPAFHGGNASEDIGISIERVPKGVGTLLTR